MSPADMDPERTALAPSGGLRQYVKIPGKRLGLTIRAMDFDPLNNNQEISP